MNYLIRAIEDWAEDRNLIEGSNPQAQFVKLMEEAGELAGNISRGKSVQDDIGDMVVVLTIIARMYHTTLEECVFMAYQDIKDRKGRMVDGIFVKEQGE